MTLTDGPVAAWQVSGETFCEMNDEAFSDGQLFMQGVPETQYEIDLINCQPRRKFDEHGKEVGVYIEDGRILEWEGIAVISWRSQSQSQ